MTQKRIPPEVMAEARRVRGAVVLSGQKVRVVRSPRKVDNGTVLVDFSRR